MTTVDEPTAELESELWRRDSSRFQHEASLHRFSLDLVAGTVRETPLDDRAIEFPRVADDRVGLPNSLGYAASTSDDRHQIVRYDLVADRSTAHEFGADRVPGEPVFVPRHDADGDGYLLTDVHDRSADRSEFVVLDATDVAAEPSAGVPLPQRVPFGSHGSWIPDPE